jgi:hypothetical protein
MNPRVDPSEKHTHCGKDENTTQELGPCLGSFMWIRAPQGKVKHGPNSRKACPPMALHGVQTNFLLLKNSHDTQWKIWQWAFQKHNAHEDGQLCFQKACQRIMLPNKASYNTLKKIG